MNKIYAGKFQKIASFLSVLFTIGDLTRKAIIYSHRTFYWLYQNLVALTRRASLLLAIFQFFHLKISPFFFLTV